ncbi:MAG TPA: nucleotidyltransferase domain-containing protein, partial [bacterium]|nr:nucleotidyltransferase domain-containing protein [bacterium]
RAAGAGRAATVAPEVMRAAREVADRLANERAAAVALVGGHVRGDAHEHSDIDLIALGRGPVRRLEVHDPFVVAVRWRTPAQVRDGFADLRDLSTVPGWRRAVILYDPKRQAAALKREALAWTWDAPGPRVDAWVAEQITGYAEEVLKLVGGLRAGGRYGAAAAQRSVLALRLPRVMAVHRRTLYDGDSQLYEAICAGMGEPWRRAHRGALGVQAETLEQTCGAALALFALAAEETKQLLDERQFAVVRRACAAAGFPIGRRPAAREAIKSRR